MKVAKGVAETGMEAIAELLAGLLDSEHDPQHGKRGSEPVFLNHSAQARQSPA